MSVSVLIVTLVAFVTPMVLQRFKISVLPTAVAEVLVGIVIGKSGFDLVQTECVLSFLSNYGVIFLLFLSGMEIDFSLFKKNNGPLTPLARKKAANAPSTSPVQVAVVAYGGSLLMALALALLFKFSGLFSNFALAAILFSTVALGVVIAVLKENELLNKPLGQALLLIAVLGEIVPLLCLTVYSSFVSGKGESAWLIFLLFIVGALIFKRFRSFFTSLDEINKSTTQIDIRLALLVITTLVVLAESVGAEDILGAFIAGIVIKLLQPAHSTQEKLDAIGYGIFIPFFFILTGAKIDIPGLLGSPKTLILIPLFFAAYVLAKVPAYFGLRQRFKRINALAGAMLSQTTITLVLATLTVAQNLKVITSEQSGAFILAAVVSCILGPLVFNKLHKPEPEDLKKTKVTIIGVNLVTINTAEQLNEDWYDIQMYTNWKKNYKTYDYRDNVHLVDSLEPKDLIKEQIFDTDILVLGHSDVDINYSLALAAKEYGVERVLTRIQNSDPTSMAEMDKRLSDAGVEFFTTFATTVGMMRAIIESPSTLDLITGDSRLYEVVVRNSKFAGLELRKLPFIKEITVSRIFRHHKAIPVNGNTQIQVGDHLLFSANKDVVNDIRKKISKLNDYE
ncbi:monovalent cation:proton antiporter family protein [Ligilactobacillus animalis]|uniref:monovalent cation:proton antiporter family protein n=1 Tax=Ligilactobacillus animalis TaxID=1605 RepID=UPI0010A3AB1E|nr:cation:proton antiporter family protein [Ligilactobacillus animalis]MDO5883912.1 cation:proton antiporter [Ligilactobacillus animalis]MDU1486632.1 cation:proton antiporter [Ligilactobacillus animalis]MDU8986812.1 cation:proton antiporter [Ligilactobacillus animalis]THE20006.1 potassium transporter [Ligilactobacillus animalis]THE22186.1 potassium transporter [Ligilactobacillus animalis]